MPRRDHVRPPRSRLSVWAARLFGLAGAAVVLAVGAVALTMILPASDRKSAQAARGATPTPAPAKQRAQPTRAAGPRLTARQRTLRRRAADEVRRQGYSPVALGDYRGDHVLRVLIGAPAGSIAPGRRAFFFVGARYIGQDATTASRRVRVGRQLEREITLVYTLYRPADAACCPQGRSARVHFRWTGAALAPREPIPPAGDRLRG